MVKTKVEERGNEPGYPATFPPDSKLQSSPAAGPPTPFRRPTHAQATPIATPSPKPPASSCESEPAETTSSQGSDDDQRLARTQSKEDVEEAVVPKGSEREEAEEL